MPSASRLGMLQEYVCHEATAMAYFVDQFQLFLERVIAERVPNPGGEGVVELTVAPPPGISDLIGSSLQTAKLLGGRVADLHRAMSSAEYGEFAPEPVTDFYRQSLYHGLLGSLGRTMEFLRVRQPSLHERARGAAEQLLGAEGALREVLRPLRGTRVQCDRIRLHGDFHLDQILFTGKDFSFIDFEGDPSRPASERRIKGTAVRDLAALVWSLNYAAQSVFFQQLDRDSAHAGYTRQSRTSARLERSVGALDGVGVPAQLSGVRARNPAVCPPKTT